MKIEKKKRPTPSSSRIIVVPFQMIRGKRENKHSAQNSSTSLEFHMRGEGGGNLGVSSSLFLFMFTKLPVAVVGVCSQTSSNTWGPFQMSPFVSLNCVDSRVVDAV